MRDNAGAPQPNLGNINLRLKAYRATWPRARKIRLRKTWVPPLSWARF